MTTTPFGSLLSHARQREASPCQIRSNRNETQMNRSTNTSQTRVAPYQLRLKGENATRSASELNADIRSTVNRIRNLVRDGDTKLALALTFVVNRMRDEVANATTRIQFIPWTPETQDPRETQVIRMAISGPTL